MSNLRKLARGRSCQIRLPCCNSNPETVVLAHYRSVGLGAGMGLKPADWLGAWSCSACHDAVDGRALLYDRTICRLAHAEGVLRTLTQLISEGFEFTKREIA